MKKLVAIACALVFSLTSMAQRLETGGQLVEISADLSGEAALNTIMKTYSGRVVVLDFWATWCGPCRMAMKEIDKIKPELIEKNVAFVYVTGETSPLEKFNEMRPEIDGYHYRLTDAQWREICQMMQLVGIPAYAVYGKDGTILFSNLTEGGFPGNEVIREAVEEGLK